MKLAPHAIVAAAAITLADPASAQDTANSTATVSTVPVDRDDDNDSPWGLLGRKKNGSHVDRTDNIRR